MATYADVTKAYNFFLACEAERRNFAIEGKPARMVQNAADLANDAYNEYNRLFAAHVATWGDFMAQEDGALAARIER